MRTTERFAWFARWISCIRSSSSVKQKQRMANELFTCPIVCGGSFLNGKRNLSVNGSSRISSSRSYRWIRAKPIASSKQSSKRGICPTSDSTICVTPSHPTLPIRASRPRPCPRSLDIARRASRWTTINIILFFEMNEGYKVEENLMLLEIDFYVGRSGIKKGEDIVLLNCLRNKSNNNQ